MIQQGISSDDFNIDQGGYWKIGKLVIVDIRVTTKKEIPTQHDALIKGFPTPSSSGYNYIPVSEHNKGSYSKYGQIYMSQNVLVAHTISETVPINTLSMFSAVYISR